MCLALALAPSWSFTQRLLSARFHLADKARWFAGRHLQLTLCKISSGTIRIIMKHPGLLSHDFMVALDPQISAYTLPGQSDQACLKTSSSYAKVTTCKPENVVRAQPPVSTDALKRNQRDLITDRTIHNQCVDKLRDPSKLQKPVEAECPKRGRSLFRTPVLLTRTGKEIILVSAYSQRQAQSTHTHTLNRFVGGRTFMLDSA